MDPQPKALRLYVLLTTAFVLFGAMAGYALFLQQRSGPPAREAVADDEAIDAVVIHHMSPPASVDAATRTRLEVLLTTLTTDASAPARRGAGESLLAIGAAAVPSVLDALCRAATAPLAFEDAEARARLIAPDTVLAKIRLTLTPGDPAEPYRRAPDAPWCVRRIKSWFFWWDQYAATHPEVR